MPLRKPSSGSANNPPTRSATTTTAMSTPTSPATTNLPQRSNTVGSSVTSATRRTSVSDDEAIPDTDSSETTNLLIERLRALKHMCGYLENYVDATAKVQKSQSKDYEKILKTVSAPLKEGHHFSQSIGGIASFFENMRSNTQGMVNMYLDTEKNLKGSVFPILERLHKEIKAKSKEVKTGASKSAKAVEKARGVTQKHIELLAQHTASFDAAAGNKVDQQHDPYVLRRGITHRLNKQITEENNNRQDILSVQNNFQQFEAHVIQTVQGALDQFFQFMGGQLDRQRAMYGDVLASAQKVPPDFEWVNFVMRNDAVLIDPDSPPRSLANVNFPNQDHRATQPTIEGSLERKSRAVIKGYSTGYYVVSPARYLHEFKDDDDLRRDPSPELSLYLPDCVIGAIDGVKFNVKGKDVSSGKVGNAFHTATELSFKAHTPSDAEKWWTVIKDASRGPVATVHTSTPAAAAAPATSPTEPTSAVSPTSPAAGADEDAEPPAYSEKNGNAAVEPEKAESPADPGSASPSGLSRTGSTGHFYTAPGGSATDEKKG